MTIDTLSPSSETVSIQDAVVTVGRWFAGLFAFVLLLGTVSTAVGQETFTLDNQGWSNGQIIGAPVTITEGSFTLSFQDVNTSISDFEYRIARTGDLNYQSSGRLEITTDGGGKIDAQSIYLGFVDGSSTDGDPAITGSSVTITGYRNGTQVAQFTDDTNIVGGTNTEIGLSSRDPGFGSVDKITVKANSITGGAGIRSEEFLTFDNVTVGSEVSPQPDIAVEDSDGTSIPDGDTSPSSGESTDFGSVAVGSNTAETYTIQNTGTNTLNISSITSSNTGDITVSSVPSSVASSGSATFDVTFAPSAGGTRSATITINSDDPDAEGTYTFSVTGDGLVPDIAVEDDGNNPLPDGSGTFDYGTVDVGSTSQRFFSIQNTGGADLSLSGLPAVELSGTHAGDFSVSATPSSPVSAGGQTSFAITFDPQASGTRTTTVTISNNDPDEDPYTFEVTGTGNNPNAAPTFTAGASTSLTFDEDAAPTSLSSQLQVDDPDGGQTLEWTVSGAPSNGTLSGLPTTESSGTGVMPSGVTYEPNTDVIGSDVDAFDIQVSDGNGGSATTTVNVTVNNLSPAFNSSNTASVPENSTGTVLDVNADNGGDGANDSGLNYALSGGADQAVFSIDATTGELSLDLALDYENPTDSDTNNDYVVEVTADDGESSNNTTTQTITVTVTDVNEPPTVAGAISDVSVDEDAPDETIDLAGAFSDPEQAAGDLTFAVENNTNSSLLTASIDNSTDQLTLSFAQDANGSATITVSATDDNSQSVTDQFDVTVSAQNDAPTISALSDQTIDEDGTLSSLSFTVDDTETSDLSTLTLTSSSGNTTLVPNSNISFAGPDAGGNASITVQPAPNASGTATITVTVDDGATSNNTASNSFVLTVNAVPDLAITDGSADDLDFTAEVSPSTDNNAVGIFELSAGQSGATLDAVTVTNNSPNVSGITNARLYLSADQTLVPGEDSQVADFDVTDGSAEGTFTFSGIGETIPTNSYYAILAIDVASGASASGIQFSLDQTSDLSVTGGEIATVNGASQSTFSALPLSNGTTELPVEMASFEATSERETVTLQWQTASETDNAGFEIQRKGERGKGREGAWMEIASIDGAGTTDEPQTYRFSDSDVPYEADSLTYRLRQVDTDGSASYSEPITVARSAVQQVQLLGTYPNPARERATVRFAIPEGKSTSAPTLRLYDVMGRQVRTVQTSAEAGRHTVQLETGALSSGVYFLRLQAGTIVKTQRLTVVQ